MAFPQNSKSLGLLYKTGSHFREEGGCREVEARLWLWACTLA